MYGWYARRKRQVAGIALASAAGVIAAYYAYKWYISPSQDSEGDAHSEQASSAPRLRASASQPAAVADMESKMLMHMQRLQEVGDKQTLPDLQRQLHSSLERLIDVNAVAEQLRHARAGAAPLSAAEKLALWGDLGQRSFLLLTAAVWAAPALHLVTHVQLTVLGRHMYLETIMRDRHPDARWRLRFPASPSKRQPVGAGRAPPALPPLTPAQQEAFLSYAAFLLNDGLQTLLPLLADAVHRNVAGVPLQQPVAVADAWEMLSSIHSDVDANLSGADWAAALVPPVIVPSRSLTPTCDGGRVTIQASPEAPVQTVDNHEDAPVEAYLCSLPAQYHPMGLTDPVQVGIVAEMLLEVRQIVKSPQFMGALNAAVKHVAQMTAGQLKAAFDARAPVPATERPATCPFASVMPWVARTAHELCQSHSRWSLELSAVEQVHDLFAQVYSKGPFLNDQ